MEIWMGLGLLASSTLLCWLMSLGSAWRRWADVLACAALVGFGAIVGGAVARTIVRNTVFMTEVHGVLLNGIFLTAGAYLGIYGVALLMASAWRKAG